MRLLDALPRPRVGRPVRHPFALPMRLPHRLLRGIPPTVLSRRRMRDAELGLLPFAESVEAGASRIAEVIRDRLLDLRRGLRRLHDAGREWSARS
jgi:hypothetical protein